MHLWTSWLIPFARRWLVKNPFFFVFWQYYPSTWTIPLFKKEKLTLQQHLSTVFNIRIEPYRKYLFWINSSWFFLKCQSVLRCFLPMHEVWTKKKQSLGQQHDILNTQVQINKHMRSNNATLWQKQKQG